MEKIFIIIIFLISCSNQPGIDGSEFIGKWKMSENSPNYSKDMNKISIEISKKGIFFWVSMKMDGKDLIDEITKDETTNEVKEFAKASHQYQLSPDKQTLIPVNGMLDYTITYHDDNKTIQNAWGWFEKK